jgi:hypothetical protein
MQEESVDVFTVIRVYEALRRRFQPYYRVGNMDLRHRNWVHFQRTAEIIGKLDADVNIYLSAQFESGEVPYPTQLYSTRAHKRYHRWVKKNLPDFSVCKGVVDGYVERFAKAWNVDTKTAREFIERAL